MSRCVHDLPEEAIARGASAALFRHVPELKQLLFSCSFMSPRCRVVSQGLRTLPCRGHSEALEQKREMERNVEFLGLQESDAAHIELQHSKHFCSSGHVRDMSLCCPTSVEGRPLGPLGPFSAHMPRKKL